MKILDCTLRDGGHVNNWEFGFACAQDIFKNLNRSNMEFIEIGYLRDCEYNPDHTVFNDIESINKFIPSDLILNALVGAMIDYGKFNIEKINKKTDDDRLEYIRVAFKKQDLGNVFKDLKKIKDAGYKVFVNPTSIESYSEEEIVNLISKVNKLNPYAFTIVDTNGSLMQNDIEKLYKIIGYSLNNDINLCFHFHNNMQMAFANALYVSKNAHKDVIIDTTVAGIGRAAGNLCSELLINYINQEKCNKYDILPIDLIIKNYIEPIYTQTPWGYSIPYYLSAINHCHPNYAKYLADKNIPSKIIAKLLEKIPNKDKSTFDKEIIEQISLQNI